MCMQVRLQIQSQLSIEIASKVTEPTSTADGGTVTPMLACFYPCLVALVVDKDKAVPTCIRMAAMHLVAQYMICSPALRQHANQIIEKIIIDACISNIEATDDELCVIFSMVSLQKCLKLTQVSTRYMSRRTTQ
jgi:hypothetical protein